MVVCTFSSASIVSSSVPASSPSFIAAFSSSSSSSRTVAWSSFKREIASFGGFVFVAMFRAPSGERGSPVRWGCRGRTLRAVACGEQGSGHRPNRGGSSGTGPRTWPDRPGVVADYRVKSFRPARHFPPGVLRRSAQSVQPEAAARGQKWLPQVADARDAGWDIVDAKVLDRHAALDFIPAHRDRNGGPRPRAHRVDGGQRLAPGVLIVVDEHAPRWSLG